MGYEWSGGPGLSTEDFHSPGRRSTLRLLLDKTCRTHQYQQVPFPWPGEPDTLSPTGFASTLHCSLSPFPTSCVQLQALLYKGGRSGCGYEVDVERECFSKNASSARCQYMRVLPCGVRFRVMVGAGRRRRWPRPGKGELNARGQHTRRMAAVVTAHAAQRNYTSRKVRSFKL
eukprot:6190699-Pleurochrysis_carterae.AAC.1